MIYKDTKQVLTALHQISRLTMTGMSWEELARTILETVSEALSYDRVALYLLREGTTLLEGVINVGCKVSVKGLKYDLERDDCVETRVVRSGEIIQIQKDVDDGLFSDLDKRRNAALKRSNCVLVPVITDQGVVGTMLADRSFRQEEISNEDIEILEIFCNQIGIGVENRRLNTHKQRQINDLFKLQQISRQMSDVKDMGDLQQLIVSRGVRLGGAQAGWLLLNEGHGDKLVPVSEFAVSAEDFWAFDIKKQLRESLVTSQVLFRPVQKISAGGESQPVGILSLPLLIGKRQQGVLILLYRELMPPVNLNFDLMKIFAGQADKAMERFIFNRTLIEDRDFRESILRSSPNAIITLNSALQITSYNRMSEEFFGSLEPDWQGSIFALLDSPSFRRALGEVAGRQQSSVQLEMCQTFATPCGNCDSVGGGEKIFFVNVASLGVAPDGDLGLLVLVQDQTEKRKTDQEVERMRRLASIGQLAAGIAHEIRNPLTGMNISLDIISNELTDRPHVGKLVAGVVDEIDRLENIVSSMLEFSRAGMLEKSWVDLKEMLDGWFPIFQEQARRVEVEASLQMDSSTLPAVHGDSEKLKQVVMNLGLNALDAAREGAGQVTVMLSLGNSRGEDFAVGANLGIVQSEQPWLWLKISDSGPGMQREIIEKIYDPFFTTKNRGTGLGLSIVHNIIKEHGGHLEVESEPGKGSTFAVGLPAGEAQPRYKSIEDVQSNTYN
ncbi:MAG: GAF domain-containing protein [Deltaproteobacteria bacterium]|nr:GAF domain-containing protein [Candidatus Tharpella sp.]